MSEPIWLDLEVVLAIHDEQLAEHGGQAGVRARGEPGGTVGGHHQHDAPHLVGGARHGDGGQQSLVVRVSVQEH